MLNNNTSKHALRYCMMTALWCLFAGSGQTYARQELRIYLPQEKTLSSDVITLGQVGKILGDAELREKAGDISLGQFSLPGQEIRIDRQTIRSRLAGSEIHASILFNGAETTRLRREGNCIQAELFTTAAETCLKKALTGEPVASMTLTRSPDSYPIVCDSNEITLVPRLSNRQSPSTKRVTVSAMHGNTKLYEQEVVFSVDYHCNRLVTVQDVAEGTALTSENTKLESYIGNHPSGKAAMLEGMLARRPIAAGTEIRPSLVEPKEPVVLIKRRQKVLLRLQSGGLFVSASGEAMDDACAGEIIEVRRGTGRDQRIVTGKVMPDGTVEPIL